MLIGGRFLVLVGDRFRRWAVCAIGGRFLVLVGDRFRRWAVCAIGGRCVLIGGRFLVLVGIFQAPSRKEQPLDTSVWRYGLAEGV